jgi:ATP-dependent 26S proteasome regulatory subunit
MCALKLIRLFLHVSLRCSIGMFTIRAQRDYVQEDDFSKAVRKVAKSKKLESKFDYKAPGSS